MIEAFQAGYDFFSKNAPTFMAAVSGQEFAADRIDYVNAVAKEIEIMEENINSLEGYSTANNILGGDVAEFWHAGTYNIDAAMNDSTNRMAANRVTDFGSVDISGDAGNYGSKYFSTADATAKAQAKSVYEGLKDNHHKANPSEFEKISHEKGYDKSQWNDALYQGQYRLIPADQMQDAAKWLEQKIAKEATIRPEQVKRYEDALKFLRDKISDSDGNESVPLSKAESTELAQLAKDGEFDAEKFGFVAPDVIDFEMVMKESLKAGANAAVISMALRVGPEVYKAISYLIETGELQEDQFKKIGFAALTGGTEGFIRGSVAAAITTCCKSGALGESLQTINPTIVSAVTVVAMNTIKGSYKVAIGEKTGGELASELVRDMFVSTCSLIGGGISQAFIEVPIIGYMVGSFVGSLAGSFIYNAGYSTTISFCADSGFTVFGLVEQDYELPEEIVVQMGLDTFEYELFDVDRFQIRNFAPSTFSAERFDPGRLDVKVLRRGVIGVSKIGYAG